MNLYEIFSECINIPYSQIGRSANYATAKDKDTLYIFFEDSDGIDDWVRNIDFPAIPYKRMEQELWFAHRGFLEAWKDIEPALSEFIADKKFSKIVVAGYSHGAAIAVLCHEYIWFNRPDLRGTIEGYGFGCPRVIWGTQSKELKKRWERFSVIRNIDDIVTHLPPSILGYSHVGQLIEIGESGKYSPIEAHYAENILAELEKEK